MRSHGAIPDGSGGGLNVRTAMPATSSATQVTRA